jgi:hypothetical protein
VRSVNDGPVFSYRPTIDGAGTRVALEVDWGQVMGGPQSNRHQGAVVDFATGDTHLITPRHGTTDQDGDGQSTAPLISANGRVVVHTNSSTDLLATAFASAQPRVYRYDLPTPPGADADADGIDDDVDADGGDGSLPGQYNDGSKVYGTVTFVPSGFSVAISDHPDPLQGVIARITGTGTARVRISSCGGYPGSYSAGADAWLTCGSLITSVIAGNAAVDLDGGLAVVTMPAGTATEVAETTDGFVVTVLDAVGDAGGSVQLNVDGVVRPLAAGVTSFQAWDFVGFDRPVDGGGVINTVKAGRVVPLKWRVLDSDGAPVTDIASVSVTFAAGSCATANAVADAVEQTATNASGLQNLGNGYYQLNWKTPRNPTPCGELRLALGDGVLRTALFGLS